MTSNTEPTPATTAEQLLRATLITYEAVHGEWTDRHKFGTLPTCLMCADAARIRTFLDGGGDLASATPEPIPAARHLWEAARDAGLTGDQYDTRFDDMPHGVSVLKISVPSGGEIWISNEDGTVHHEPETHTGWEANHYPDPEDSDGIVNVYESTSTDCAADSLACIQAVTAWLANH